MYRPRSKKDRRVLRGWIKWIPVLGIPFSILFFHAWINIQILRADYVLRELNSKSRQLAGDLESTDSRETMHEDPEVLAERAALLEFVQPTPGQREIIYYDPASVQPHPEDQHLRMAHNNGPTVATPASDESRAAQSALATNGAPFMERSASAPAPALSEPAPVSEPVPAAAEQPVPTPVATAASPTPETTMVTTPVVLPLAPSPEATPPSREAPPAPPEAEPVVLDLPPDTRGLNPLDENMGGLDSL